MLGINAIADLHTETFLLRSPLCKSKIIFMSLKLFPEVAAN
jgi:hypothetical protein